MAKKVLENYCICEKSSLKGSLEKIRQNKHEFLVVISDKEEVVGVLTIGDITRALLEGEDLDATINKHFNRDFKYLTTKSTFEDVVDEFRNPVIRFLPILDDGELANIITKKQFHAYMIEDMPFDINYDFFSLDEGKNDHEVFGRPWGFYKTVFLNDYSRAKIISIFPGEEISLQEHAKRDEHWVVIKGKGRLLLESEETEITSGKYVNIPRGTKHKLKNTSNEETLMVSEVQLGEYFGEDDIIRHKDKYGRS